MRAAKPSLWLKGHLPGFTYLAQTQARLFCPTGPELQPGFSLSYRAQGTGPEILLAQQSIPYHDSSVQNL